MLNRSNHSYHRRIGCGKMWSIPLYLKQSVPDLWRTSRALCTWDSWTTHLRMPLCNIRNYTTVEQRFWRRCFPSLVPTTRSCVRFRLSWPSDIINDKITLYDHPTNNHSTGKEIIIYQKNDQAWVIIYHLRNYMDAKLGRYYLRETKFKNSFVWPVSKHYEDQNHCYAWQRAISVTMGFSCTSDLTLFCNFQIGIPRISLCSEKGGNNCILNISLILAWAALNNSNNADKSSLEAYLTLYI